MKITVTIEADCQNESACSSNCPFLDAHKCILFNEELEDTQLDPPFEWVAEPTKDRFWKCLNL